MKKLLIVRHAKSDWANANLADFDRPLNKRGQNDAPEMALRILNKGFVPQAIVSSPAMRAITTATYLANTWELNPDHLSTNQGIYEATANRLLRIINTFQNTLDYIALTGHNPGLSDLIHYLTGKGFYDLPTCGMALIEFPIENWELVSGGTGTLKWVDYPKNESNEQ